MQVRSSPRPLFGTGLVLFEDAFFSKQFCSRSRRKKKPPVLIEEPNNFSVEERKREKVGLLTGGEVERRNFYVREPIFGTKSYTTGNWSLFNESTFS